MNNVREGCREKIARAVRHMHDLDVEWHIFADTNAKAFVSHYRGDPVKNLVHVEVFYDGAPPPVVLGVILGEIVHNLRSALDNLAWALVPTEVRERLSRQQRKRIRFPASTSFEDFQKEAIVLHVGEDTRAVLERCQPYHSGNEALAVLHAFWTTDKHRTIPVAAMIPNLAMLDGAIRCNPDALLLERKIEIEAGRPLEPQAKIASLTFRIPGPHPDVRVNGKVALHIAFQEDGGSDARVRTPELAKYVSGVLRATGPLLRE